MKVVRLIPLLCLASLCFAQYNFQERVIWYGPDEYVCKKHFGEDTIDLVIHFNQSTIVRIEGISGGTGCHSALQPISIIWPTYGWDYITLEGDRIKFSQTPTYETFGSKIMRIVQNSTVENPIMYQNQKYNCTIIGNGQRLHFGQNPGPEHVMKCTFLPPSQQIEIE